MSHAMHDRRLARPVRARALLARTAAEVARWAPRYRGPAADPAFAAARRYTEHLVDVLAAWQREPDAGRADRLWAYALRVAEWVVGAWAYAARSWRAAASNANGGTPCTS